MTLISVVCFPEAPLLIADVVTSGPFQKQTSFPTIGKVHSTSATARQPVGASRKIAYASKDLVVAFAGPLTSAAHLRESLLQEVHGDPAANIDAYIGPSALRRLRGLSVLAIYRDGNMWRTFASDDCVQYQSEAFGNTLIAGTGARRFQNLLRDVEPQFRVEAPFAGKACLLLGLLFATDALINGPSIDLSGGCWEMWSHNGDDICPFPSINLLTGLFDNTSFSVGRAHNMRHELDAFVFRSAKLDMNKEGVPVTSDHEVHLFGIVPPPSGEDDITKTDWQSRLRSTDIPWFESNYTITTLIEANSANPAIIPIVATRDGGGPFLDQKGGELHLSIAEDFAHTLSQMAADAATPRPTE